jgi:DNA-binding transcriptional ArsR family regulator
VNGQDTGATVNDWTDVVRRARLGRTVKLVALLMASRANPDGTRVFPGVARLAVECEADYSTVRRALARLRGAGLIEVVRRGARRSGKSDEYRLIFAEDLLERCSVPDPAELKQAIEALAEKKKHRSTAHRRPVERPAGNTDHSSPVSRTNGSTAQNGTVLQLTGELPPLPRPVPERQPPSNTAADAVLNGQVARTRVTATADPASPGGRAAARP